MIKFCARRVVAALVVSACAGVGAVSFWPATGYVRTDDHNNDGRPDVWRFYDRRGQLARIDTDTNFDGRSDQQEYYRLGALVHRESDRNFDNRVDLVEDFEPTSGEAVRSVTDLDFDGVADLLVLFQDGRAVLSKRVTRPFGSDELTHDRSAEARQADEFSTPRELRPLFDPFRSDTTARSATVAVDFEWPDVLLPVLHLPLDRLVIAGAAEGTDAFSPVRPAHARSTMVSPDTTRGPPLLLLA